eukprot:scaffold627_cov125-Cylindrotheca_fusiformis.AAC.17
MGDEDLDGGSNDGSDSDSYSDSCDDYDSEYSSRNYESDGDYSWTESDDEENIYEDDWSMEEEKRVEMASKEWSKCKKVQNLLRSVNDYMAIYSRLKESGELVIIGSEGIQKPKHIVPSEYVGDNKAAWDDLGQEEQFNIILEQAKETLDAMASLGANISEKYNVQYKQGPLKGEKRVKEKRDRDYNGDIRRVIDLVRCSFVVAMENMKQAKDIIDLFRRDTGEMGEEWMLIRVKDGFEKAENFLVGGYRDVKVNVRYMPTGHIIEIQLHLKPYLEMKENGGHEHYEFARSLNVTGVTNAAQILHPKLLKMGYITDFGQGQLSKMIVQNKKGGGKEGQAQNGRIAQARVLRTLGDLYSEERRYGKKAVRCYDRALRALDKKPLKGRPAKVLCCQILLGMAYCVAEIQRHPDTYPANEKYMTMDVIPLTERGLALCKETVGESHPYSLRFERIQADYYDSTERSDMAIPIYESVLERMRTILGNDHPETIECSGNYGDLCIWREDEGSLLRGYKLYMAAFEAALNRLGPDHPTTDNLIASIMSTAEDELIFDKNPELKTHLLHVLSNPKWSYRFEGDIKKIEIEDWSDSEEYSDDDDGDY